MSGLRSWWEPWRDGLAPILLRELQARTRLWPSPALLTGYLLALAAGVAGALWLTIDRAETIPAGTGLQLFAIVAATLVLLVGVIAPVLGAGAISGERERRTYDLLFVTPASAGGVVLGKWLAAVAYLLLLVVASLPALGVVFLFGGLPLGTLLNVLWIAGLTALGYGAVGICLSTLLPRTQAAVVGSLLMVLCLACGTLVVAALARPTGSVAPLAARPPLPPYAYLSPVTALGSTLPNAPLDQLLLALSRLLQPSRTGFQGSYFFVSSPGPLGSLPAHGWPGWVRFALDQAGLTVLALAVAALAAPPVRLWSLWRARRQGRA